MTNYYALHYHMKNCGVKFVIDNIFRAINKFSNINCNLLYSEKDKKYTFSSVNSIDIPQLSYDNKIFSSKEEFESRADLIKEKIKSKLDLGDKCVIHAHNLNLMKNPAATRAIKLLAEDVELKGKLGIILQVHDFAEDNRETLLYLMRNVTGVEDENFASELAYPTSENITYCTINSRDKKILEKAGIKNVKLFPNNVDCEYLSGETFNEGILDKLATFANENNYNFSPKRKILLSPLKIIRRKNVVETILILNALNSFKDEWQLLITLDASSDEDKIYSEKIKNYIKKNNLPVTIGFGFEFISPDEKRTDKFPFNLADLFSISDVIITTSKQEGFGMSYLEGWVAKKPVVGRRIDFIFEDFEKNKINLDHFYSRIDINGKDFKDIPYDIQIETLDKIDLVKLRDELKEALEFIENPPSEIIQSNKKVIEKEYSLDAYFKKIKSLIDNSFEKNYNGIVDNSKIIEFFKNE